MAGILPATPAENWDGFWRKATATTLADVMANASRASQSLKGGPGKKWERKQLLPFEEHKVTGDWRLAMPQVVEDMISGMAVPGNALRGKYNQVQVAPDGSVSQFDPRMIDDASSLAGMVTLGAGALPAEAGALRMGADNFASLLEQARNRLTTRNAAVAELVATGAKAIKFNGPSGRALASPDMSSKGKFRLTYFDKSGVPNGHLEFQSFEEAVRQALIDGFAAQKDTKSN